MEPDTQMLQPEGSRRRICKVCVRQYASYTCPRCNLPYCSLDCYKQHGERCTESFYRDQAVTQLRGTRASADERRHMLQVLARVHEAGDSTSNLMGQTGSYGEADEDEDEEEGSSDDGGDDAAVFGAIRGILSEATKAKLKQKAEAALAEGRDFEFDAGDLAPAERAALERLALEAQEDEGQAGPAAAAPTAAPAATAATAGAPGASQLLSAATAAPAAGSSAAAAAAAAEAAEAAAAAPWVPWWLTDEAKMLQLSPSGQPLVAELAGTQATQNSSNASASSSSASTALPPPPAEPLPRLSALTRAEPSPLLRWQLLQLLFGYCVITRLRREQRGMDALQVAEQLLALTPPLDSPAAAEPQPQTSTSINVSGNSRTSSSNISSSAAADASRPAALDARTAFSACLARACTPPTGSGAWRQAALKAVGDAAALLGLGRSAVVLALTDAGSMLDAGMGALKQAGGTRASGIAGIAGTAGAAGTAEATGQAGGTSEDRAGLPASRPASRDAQALKRRLKAATAKVRFFTVWANEQEAQALQLLAAATNAERQQQEAALSSSHSGATGGISGTSVLVSQVTPGAMNGAHTGAAARQPQAGTRRLVQVLPQSAHKSGAAATATPAHTPAAAPGTAAPASMQPAMAAVLPALEPFGSGAAALSRGAPAQQQALDVFELD